MNTTELLEQENEEQIICDKQIKIYHIRNVKVGSSCRLEARLKQQGYQVDDCEVLATIEANTLTYREVWETEQDYAVMKGFEPENEGNWKNFYKAHTNNNTNDPAVRAKMSEAQKGEKHHFFGKSLSDEHKAKLSEARKGSNNPASRSYYIINCKGVVVATVNDAAGYEQTNGLARGALRDAANPNRTRRFITLNGIKHTVAYKK